MVRFLTEADGTCAGIVCAVDAVCVTTQNGAQVCECKAGFTGNGLDCRGKKTWKFLSKFSLLTVLERIDFTVLILIGCEDYLHLPIF